MKTFHDLPAVATLLFLSLPLAVPLLGCASTQRANDPAAANTQKGATMPVPRRPVPLIEHRLASEEILRRIDAAEAACEKRLSTLVALPDDQRTFSNTVEELEQAVADYWDAAGRLGILKDVHPDEKVRDASATAEEKAGKYLVRISTRRDLYQAMKGYLANAGQTERLDPVQKRLVELTMRDFRRSGLELPDDKLARMVAIGDRLTELGVEFSRNLNENQDSIEVTQEELEGLPPSFVERLKKTEAGKWIVTTKYPDFFPFMDNAKNEGARKRLYIAFQSREAARNTPMLKEAIRLREEKAKLLGYANHADFVTEVQMAKNAATVKDFLAALKEQLKPRRDADYEKLVALKRSETGDPKARLEPWDARYYFNQIKKRDYSIDAEALREYFPANVVLEGMFGVYEQLLSIDLREVKDADVWAPEVKLYEIVDKDTGDFIGHFYADLFPRPGKYGHAASASVTVAREVNGVYRAPIALVMANFNPPSGDRPSLLSHDEVETLFHEFGHAMHQTLTTARYGSMSGTSVARDFVETPSQVLENWVFEKEVLDRMSGHWQDPSKKLPAETVAKLKEARTYDAGYHYTRQVFLATFDQTLHTSGPEVDPDAVDKKLFQEILGLEPVAETHFPATFGHMMGGYDAGYYGYLWAEVFADDLFTLFQEKGILDPELGRRYRDVILAKGRTVEADELLRQFLGREPNNAAFLRKLGIR